MYANVKIKRTNLCGHNFVNKEYKITRTDTILDISLFCLNIPIEIRKIILQYFNKNLEFSEYFIYPMYISLKIKSQSTAECSKFYVNQTYFHINDELVNKFVEMVFSKNLCYVNKKQYYLN